MSKNTATKKAGTRKDLTKTQWILKEVVRNKVAYFMVAPFMFVFILFTLFPVLLSFILSFTSFNMLEIDWDIFIGLDNYTRLFFEDDIFLQACKNTLVFAMVIGPVSYILSFLVAWFINELAPKLRAVITLIFYAPSIAGNVYLIWATMFSMIIPEFISMSSLRILLWMSAAASSFSSNARLMSSPVSPR